MVRFNLKGGIWTNAEDELLKVGIMKYGKQNWGRVASLLHRKSPQQCKARWTEWLDPSIKKTEWTREEEEKLLHLAKIMPHQWRTIAPMVGRTAAQCIEHFTKLSDIALGRDTTAADAADPRALRAGEIDPQPEAKPARPDAVDMDEDEKEMLQEARARISNIRGKKATRQARQKYLEDAHRQAQLQKTRELLAAGIEVKPTRKKKKEVDFVNEIRFHHPVPMGEFDTSEERKQTSVLRSQDEKFIGANVNELDGHDRHRKEQEARERDLRREKLRREVALPDVIRRLNELNDAPDVRDLAPMALPRPNVDEADLELLAKTGALSSLTEIAANIRTPLGAGHGAAGAGMSSREYILNEMKTVLALNTAQTPLKGGENAPIAPTDFSGATPRQALTRMQTPNPAALALQQQRMGTMGGRPGTARPGTLMGPGGRMMGPGATPLIGPQSSSNSLSDALHALGTKRGPSTTTTGMGMGEMAGVPLTLASNDPRAQTQRQFQNARKRIKTALANLPDAENEYALVWPSLPDDVEIVASATLTEVSAPQALNPAWKEDAEQRMRHEALQERARADLEEQRRSTCLRRQFPRPRLVNTAAGVGVSVALEFSQLAHPTSESTTENATLIKQAEELIRSVSIDLLRRDHIATPVSGRTSAQLTPAATKKLEAVNESLGVDPSGSALARAQALVNAELIKMRWDDAKPLVRPPTFLTRRADGTLVTGAETLVPRFPEAPNRTLAFTPASTDDEAVIPANDVIKTWDEVYEHITFVPSLKRFAWLEGVQSTDPITPEEAEKCTQKEGLISALRQEAQLVQGQRDSELARALKLEQGVKVLHGGYEARLKKLNETIDALWTELQDARLNLSCFQVLRDQETNVRIPARLQLLRNMIQEQKQIENRQQSQFVQLTHLLEETLRAKKA